MQLTADQAKMMAGFFLADYARESPTLKKVIAAIPSGQESYAPDARSMNAIDLAYHTASADIFFLESVAEGGFSRGESKRPESIKTAADVLSWYDTALAGANAKIGAASGEELAKPIDFFGMMTLPAVVFLQLMIKHSVHHRGQLSAYLRPMGAKVPSIYGPSADEGISASA